MKVESLRYFIYPFNLLLLLNMFEIAQADQKTVNCNDLNRGSVCNGSVNNNFYYPTKINTLPNGITLKVTGYGASFTRNEYDKVVVAASVSVENTSSKDVLLVVSGNYTLISNSGQASRSCRLDGLKTGYPSTHIVDYQRISAKTQIVIALTDCEQINPLKTSSVSINIPVLELLVSSNPLIDNKVVPYTINSGKIPIK